MKNKLIIISPFPKKGTYSHRGSALASFNKNLVDSIKFKFDIVILDDQKTWKKNDFFNYFNLIKAVSRYKEVKNILIQFEWGVFGKNIFFVMLFPIFLLILKFLSKKTYVVLHGISFDFKSIFNDNLKTKLLNMGARIFYNLSCLFAYKIITTENYFKKQLSELSFGKNKVIFIPHGVDIRLKTQDKKRSDKFSLGYFGYLHPYKGPKLLLDLFSIINYSELSLTFFGGKSPNLVKNKDYREYMKDFYLIAKKNKVKITGFVEQNKLSKYFAEVDLIILPYPTFISSSGMLAMALSYEKPFILSQPLVGYFDSPDFAETLKETGLKKEDFLFGFNQKSFKKRLTWAKNHLDELAKFSRIMKEKRDWKKVAKQYEKLF